MSSGLYTQPQYQPPQYPSAPQPYSSPPQSGNNWILSLFLVGGGVLLLVSVLIVGAVWYAVSSLEGWAVGFGREVLVAVVDESDIPPAEKREVVAQIDRVVDAYKKKEIDQDDLDRLLTGLDDSAVMTYISYYGLQDYYLEDTTLPEAEQAELQLAWRRATYGMFTDKISIDDFYDALPFDDHFEGATEKEANELMSKWTARMKKLADKAGIPDDPPAVDIGDETKKLVDELLAK
ncbi:MAG: hypothetical protein L0211_12405 [Planctomycetaceae bacterium]|nr:hypothetical protein [Planctomycetaceae bacterium]